MSSNLRRGRGAWIAAVGALLAAAACGSSDTPSGTGGAGAGGQPAKTGSSCASSSECYRGLDGATVLGQVECLDHVTSGYCTHQCTTDADCCAIPGECAAGLRQVCASFESTGQMLCFFSCDGADLQPPSIDPSVFCQHQASADFGCRSTGGGAKNRKACLP